MEKDVIFDSVEEYLDLLGLCCLFSDTPKFKSNYLFLDIHLSEVN